MRVALGALLVLAIAVPVSASVITTPSANYLVDTFLINPSPVSADGTFYASVSDASFVPGSWWFTDMDPSGDNGFTPGNSSSEDSAFDTSSLTIDFSNPVTIFGFQLSAQDLWAPDKTPLSNDFIINAYSGLDGTGVLLDTATPTLTADAITSPWGIGFFEIQDTPIGSVTIQVTNDTGFGMSELRVDPVPESSTSLLLGVGLLGLGLVTRRRLASIKVR